MQSQIASIPRSGGLGVSRPVREGGELHQLESLEARRAGTNRGAPSALRKNRRLNPALTDGAINCRSLGAAS
jgi:hypothetical protein